MDRDQLLQKLQTAAANNAERASDCADPNTAAAHAGAALALTQAIAVLLDDGRGVS